MLWLLLVSILFAACQNANGTAVSDESVLGQVSSPTRTAAPTMTPTLLPTLTATATATPTPSPTPAPDGPPPLGDDGRYAPEALAAYADYVRSEFTQPEVDAPVREAIMAVEGLNFILIPIPNEFQQQVSFVPHPAGEMVAVFVPDSTVSLLALLEDPAWLHALTNGYASSSGAPLGQFEFKELAVDDIIVVYLVYRSLPEPDRAAFGPADILHASGGYRGLSFTGPIE
jgi:hypothetical protein